MGDEQRIARAVGLLEQRRPGEALPLLTESVRLEPDSMTAWCELARCRHALGDPAGMLAAAERAVSIAPGHERPHRTLAFALIDTDRADEAVVTALTAVRLSPDDDRTHNVLAYALRAAGRHAEAAAAAEAAVALAPVEAGNHIVAGLAYEELDRRVSARAAYSQATASAPDNPVGWHNLATLDIPGRPARALAAFARAARLDPRDPSYPEGAWLAARLSVQRLAFGAALLPVLLGLALLATMPADPVRGAIADVLLCGWAVCGAVVAYRCRVLVGVPVAGRHFRAILVTLGVTAGLLVVLAVLGHRAW